MGQPTGNTSRGFSIKQLTFDQQGQKLQVSRVNRQMTAEEQQMMLRPGVRWVHGVMAEVICGALGTL